MACLDVSLNCLSYQHACLMILGVSRLATMRAIVLAKHSPKRNVGADELVVRLYLSLVDRPIALAPKIVGIAIDDLGGLVCPSGFE